MTLVVGKFYPPHRGHKHLIDTARRWITWSPIAHHPLQVIPGELRKAWLKEIHSTVTFDLCPTSSKTTAHNGPSSRCVSSAASPTSSSRVRNTAGSTPGSWVPGTSSSISQASGATWTRVREPPRSSGMAGTVRPGLLFAGSC